VAVATVAAAALIGLGGGGGEPSSSVSPPPAEPSEGIRAPRAGTAAPAGSFALLDGGEASFASLAGRPVVVNFFADWCPACVAELPDFEAIHREFGDEVTFLGLDRSTSLDGATALLDDAGVTYLIGVDDGTFFQAFEGFAMPTTIFLDERGQIIDRQNGVIFESDLRDRIETLFGV
jgi:thiol-disulfide isomerase/thioredoxin